MSGIYKERNLWETLKTAFPYIRSRLLFPSSRFVRFPIYIRGKKYIDFGHGLTTGVGCRLEAFRLVDRSRPILKFGDRVQINDYVHICAMESVEIGNDVLMASHVYISDNSHGFYKDGIKGSNPDVPPIEREYSTSPVVVEDNVWVGEGVMILPGVRIGKGAIIGAHSVVNRDIPDQCIAAGSPARIIKRYNKVSGQWEKVND